MYLESSITSRACNSQGSRLFGVLSNVATVSVFWPLTTIKSDVMPREKGELELSFQVKALVNPCLAEYRAYKTEHCTPCYLAGLALLMKFSCFHNAILHPLWGQIKGIKWMLQRCAWRKGLDNGIAFIFTAFFSAWCSRRSKLWEEQDHPSHIQPFLIANHQNRIPIKMYSAG